MTNDPQSTSAPTKVPQLAMSLAQIFRARLREDEEGCAWPARAGRVSISWYLFYFIDLFCLLTCLVTAWTYHIRSPRVCTISKGSLLIYFNDAVVHCIPDRSHSCISAGKNFLRSGCLHKHSKYPKRACNSDDPPGTEQNGICIPSPFDYLEIRILNQNWIVQSQVRGCCKSFLVNCCKYRKFLFFICILNDIGYCT